MRVRRCHLISIAKSVCLCVRNETRSYTRYLQTNLQVGAAGAGPSVSVHVRFAVLLYCTVGDCFRQDVKPTHAAPLRCDAVSLCFCISEIADEATRKTRSTSVECSASCKSPVVTEPFGLTSLPIACCFLVHIKPWVSVWDRGVSPAKHVGRARG